jgi:hypothetical protein
MTEVRAHSVPRVRQWLAYLGIAIAGGSSLATSDCSESFSRTLDSELTWKPGAAYPTKTFEHNGWVTLAVISPVRVLVEAGATLPDEPSVPWPDDEPRLDEGNGGGSAGAPFVIDRETSWPGGAIVEPNTVTYVTVDCGSDAGYYDDAECSPFHVRVTPWQTTPSTDVTVSLEVTASVDAGCSEEYAVFVREAE